MTTDGYPTLKEVEEYNSQQKKESFIPKKNSIKVSADTHFNRYKNLYEIDRLMRKKLNGKLCMEEKKDLKIRIDNEILSQLHNKAKKEDKS